jgi:L-threonylcarbamoyladenylate synthase
MEIIMIQYDILLSIRKEIRLKNTVVYRLDESSPDFSIIKKCADVIKSGGVVAFPTETVYGVGANAFNSRAVREIYYAKERPASKPLLCHINSLAQAEKIAFLSKDAVKLINAFTPGPLTVIVKKRECVPDIVTADGDTVGLRFPSNKVFTLLSAEADCPIAATSANISGKISAKNGDEVISELFGRVDVIMDAGKTEFGLESTIVSLVGEPKILRQGAVARSEIERLIRL